MTRLRAAAALGLAAAVLATAAPALSAPLGLTSATLLTGSLTAPTLYATSVVTNDDRGGGRGRIDAGDSTDLGLTGSLDASTVCSVWTPAAATASLADVTVTLTDGPTDVLTFASASCPGGLHLGSVDTGSDLTAGGDVTFPGSTMTLTRSTTAATLTVAFGAPAGGKLGKPGTVSLTWTPHPALRDTAGSPVALGTAASAAGVAW